MSELLFGIHPVREALSGSRRRPLELFLLRDRSPRLEELLQAAERAGIPVRTRERGDLDRLAGSPHHQGAVLRLEPFPYTDLTDALELWRRTGKPGLLLLLDGITDPHNFGAILRSAEAAGCQAVVVARDRACPITPVVEKAAAGALAHLPVCQVTNLARTLEELKREGIWTFGLAGEAGADLLYVADLTGDVALVIGSEGSGLRPNVRRHCDRLLAIPMQGGINSLNASVAAAIALFEVVRQRIS